MAVTITVPELAAAIRITDGSAPTAPVDEILGRQLAVATDLITEYAPDAPETTANVAAIQLCQLLFDYPGAIDPLSDSGARAILAPYRALRAARVG